MNAPLHHKTFGGAIDAPEVIEPLTSLRFFAAMAVVFYHAGSTFAANTDWIPDIVANALGNGYLGVTFFFVLSGFILHYIYREKIDRPGVKRRYAVARFA